jgi:signal transduction histidine kinase
MPPIVAAPGPPEKIRTAVPELRRQSDVRASRTGQSEGLRTERDDSERDDSERDDSEREGRDGGPDEWRRFAPAWHALFAGLAVLTAAIIVTEDGVRSRPAAIGLVAALAVWYAILGRRALSREPGWSGPAYLAVAAPLTVGLFILVPVGAMLLFALYPHIWAMLRPRQAVVATVVVVGAVTAALLPRNRSDLVTVLVLTVVSLVLALLLGLWIARIIGQSRRRADLLAELEATRSELAAVSREAGVLAERERLAGEIHDTLTQGFTSVLLMLEAADTALGSSVPPENPALEAARRHLDKARHTARDNLAEARALVAALTPPDLTSTSLPEALRRLVGRVDGGSGPRAALSVTGTPRGLPAEHEVTLLRTTQEALTNARRHAGAGRVEVSLAYESGRVSLTVRDDGRGFDPTVPAPDGYGLASMRMRAARIGGVVDVVTAPGTGATVRLDLPDRLGR